MTESYDSDGPGTPALKPTTINYLPKVSPPPFDTGDQSPKGGLPKHDAEAQFPSSSQPNRPDIAWFETEHPLHRSIPADDPYPVLPKILFAPEKSSVETKEPVDVARKALNLISPSEPKEGGPSVGPKDPPIPYKEPRRPSIPVEETVLKEEQQQHTPPNIPHISHLFQDGKLPDPEARLSKLLIAPSEPTAQLPALHPSATASSVNHNLPSLSTALAGVTDVPPPAGAGRLNGSSFGPLPPVSSSSPPVSRTDPVWEHQRLGQIPPPPPQVPPSPYSHLSPASSKDMSAMSSPASQQAYWRPPIKADITYLTSTYETAPQTAKSPATSYPTPTDQTPASTCDRSYNPPTHSNGAVSTGTYKCRHPGCTAAPFQTQYLLNSHANVHSQDRPHFCPIAGCPRGPGGKGFKRKNEMIRHGLVHNSPGYVCPFCPDQQHKYPRPDNLQRHVRVHHVDKSRDDPALRQVLSQRPEGSTRGRRRRNNVP
ncbi:uncharacterized protein BO88DRAFT_348716 [Aspergillus vadensis CBS 113365]|uniref:C2H2 type zinc finger domain protein n=1 Tax=Aspergillus vadensis (strain CBS 113365 / IMI 142717 / IBT 24658) TaxID=1448311 RepID=A0A319CA27_ASPVC|nr:C2H2 type zinc finger domain protein [Aspergillus vadensis CBS 113365]PYH65512.1 C2H2 type zinc finger domain protein [Aspergillus vadensis CBS 113365]